MMFEWKATIEAWPYSTGDGQDEDQKKCGPRSQDYMFVARDVESALAMAQLIATGIKSNPAVHQAPIMAIVRVR